jgi:hypothetical protein
MTSMDTRLVGDAPTRKRFIVGSALWTLPSVVLAMAALDVLLPRIPGPIDMATRLAVAARAVALAALAVAAPVLVVAMRRFMGGAHNPLLGEEDAGLQIHCRVLSNSLEQWALFAAGAGATATFLPEAHLHLVSIDALLFLVARAVFWRGYLKPGDVLGRAPGVAMTFAVTMPFVAYGAGMSLWSLVSRP